VAAGLDAVGARTAGDGGTSQGGDGVKSGQGGEMESVSRGRVKSGGLSFSLSKVLSRSDSGPDLRTGPVGKKETGRLAVTKYLVTSLNG
jgi:hypothetical protein